MKTGAIFDMDGTLLDTEQMYRSCWMELAAEYGQQPNAAFPRAVAGTNGEQMRAVIAQYYPDVDAGQFMQDCIERVKNRIAHAVPKKEGMDEILEFLHQKGVKIAVASSSSVAQIEKNMTLAGAMPYLDAIVGGDEVVDGKPAPDIFLLAAERLGVSPQDCYVFEDGINGVRAGVAAACDTIMIPDGSFPTDEMYQICVGVYSSLRAAQQAIAQGEI